MGADRADVRGLDPHHDMPAVAALPDLDLALLKDLRGLDVLQELAIALLVHLLDGGDAAADTEAKRQMIVDYLTEHSSASSARIGASLGLSLRRTRELLRSLRQENVVAARGGGKYRVYSLRSDTRDKTH